MLLFVPPENQLAVREKLSNLLHVPFCFESRQSGHFLRSGSDYSDAEADNKSRNLTKFRELDEVVKRPQLYQTLLKPVTTPIYRKRNLHPDRQLSAVYPVHSRTINRFRG